jgi:hypothetical protein
VSGAGDSEIRVLRYAGVSELQLAEIARIKLCAGLKEPHKRLWSLPVISVVELK